MEAGGGAVHAHPAAELVSGVAARLAIGVYVACFGAATYNHAVDLIRHGWLPYRAAPLPINLFWTSLTLLDPLVVTLLLTGQRRAGVGLALAIMIADVAVNSYALFGLDYGPLSAALLMQTAFLGFVLGSAPFLWRAPTGQARRRG